jgi:hypothetical protein
MLGSGNDDEAIEAYRAALTAQSRAREPISWARTQCNLALALLAVSKRGSSSKATLRDALVAVEQAREGFCDAHAPEYEKNVERIRADIVAALQSF